VVRARTRARSWDSIQAVGETRLVHLKPGQRATLLKVLNEWANDDGGGYQMYGGIARPRGALRNDLHGTQKRERLG
jgi:hypothetical protein